MNRQQRRREEKENKIIKPDNLKTIDKLEKLNYHARFVHANFILQDCIETLLIELLEDQPLKKITKLRDYIGDLMIEHHEKETKLIKYYGGTKNMKKALEKLEPKVFGTIEELITKGAKQKEIIEIITAKFPKLSRNQLIHAYKEFKEQLEEKKEEKITVEAGAEKIMDIIEHEEMEAKVKETAKIAAKNIEEMIENSEVIEEVKEAIPEKIKVNKFKPILLQFQGEFAVYTKSKDKLVIENDGKVEISSLDVIEEMRKTEIAGLEQQIQIAKAKYAEFKEAFTV